MITLRDYQQEAIDETLQWSADNPGKNPLVDLPTGSGKSLVLSGLTRRIMEDRPKARVIMATHVKELIEQNFMALLRFWPSAPAGIYSASVGRRDIRAQVLFCGIQSIYTKVDAVQWADVIIVDEAHLISRNSETMYGKFIGGLKALNPKLQVIGLTATPYRMDQGLLWGPEKDTLFDGISYSKNVLELIEEGYLSPVSSKHTDTTLSTEGVHTRGGEFIAGELEAAVNKEDVNEACISEIIQKGQSRGSWLIFCVGVDHAEAVARIIQERGISCEAIHGKTPAAKRSRILEAYKRGEIRCLTNANVLTTGFDAPGTDLIGLLRPTKSPGLFVQIVGRGLRLANGKEDCLLLDFAGNTMRHGPIDTIQSRIDRKKKNEEPGDAPAKVCPGCEEIVAASSRICGYCGHEFPPPEDIEDKIDRKAAKAPVLSKDEETHWYPVDMVRYYEHRKFGADSRTVRVEYVIDGMAQSIPEWVCFEHSGFPRRQAVSWWQKRYRAFPESAFIPSDIDHFLRMATNAELKVEHMREPTGIRIKRNGKYFEITAVRFDPLETEEEEAAA